MARKPSAMKRTIPIAAVLPEVWTVRLPRLGMHFLTAGAKLIDPALCGQSPGAKRWKRASCRGEQACMFCERAAKCIGAVIADG